MRVSELNGQQLAILLWFVNENWESSAAIIGGILENKDGFLRLNRSGGLAPVQIPWKLVPEIKPVPDDARDIFGPANCWLEMTIRDLPAAIGSEIAEQSR